MFDPKLAIGQVLTENEVHDTFQCQTTFGIRMSKKNNLFVIMSGSAKEKIYNDVWVDDTLYYNGTDSNANSSTGQTLTTGRGNNNSQLKAVWDAPTSDKPQIFLFVKQQTNRCVYKGEVYLSKEPYEAPRHDNPSKTVWIFPLTLKNIESETNEDYYSSAEEKAYDTPLSDLYKKVKGKASKKQPENATKIHTTTSTTYDRDPEIAAYVKRRANGICDLCKNPAPFIDKHGKPYLESHHIIWLSEGGPDEIDNAVALCPNCHKKMHLGTVSSDVKILNDVVKAYKKNKR